MKEELLKELLVKYYKGETSLEEERILKECFSGNEVLPGFEAEKVIFSHYSVMSTTQDAPDDLEVRILDSINSYESNHRRTGKKLRIYSSISIAAAFMLFAVSYFLLEKKAEPKDTYSDPRLAYSETMKVLSELSVKLNKGREALKPLQIINRNVRSSLRSIGRSSSILNDNIIPISLVNKLPGSENKILNNNHK